MICYHCGARGIGTYKQLGACMLLTINYTFSVNFKIKHLKYIYGIMDNHPQ